MSEQKFRSGQLGKPDHWPKREVAQAPVTVPRGAIEVHCSPFCGIRLTSGRRIGFTIPDLKRPPVTLYRMCSCFQHRQQNDEDLS